MNNRKKTILTFAVFSLLCSLPLAVFAETNSDSLNNSETEIGLQWFMNLKYYYSGFTIHYYTPGFIYNNQFRLKFELEGFKFSKYIITEFTRLNIQTDFRIRLDGITEYRHSFSPKIGFSTYFDTYDGSMPLKGFSFAPQIGIDYEGRIDVFRFYLKNTITLFQDGLWFEVNPVVSFDVLKPFYLTVGMNMIFAFTYNGHSDAGFFPRAGINFIF
ncbi:MAG: hypothetical protein A2Y33_13890 [Spirochaetes bacterium GWF1_51_8]|nr:MAG: hypothetical protein A2Y33_13890 [Spirochaetes bacterium GWF1_51_8]